MTRCSWLPFLRCAWACASALALALGAAAPATAAGPLDRQQALQALGHADPLHRLEAMVRLADIGTAADADALMPRLQDADPTLLVVRLISWNRSGYPTYSDSPAPPNATPPGWPARALRVSFENPAVPAVIPRATFQNQFTGCDDGLSPVNGVDRATW